MAAVTLPGAHDSETAQVLEDLVRESLLPLLPVSVCLAWLWLAVTIVVDSPQLGQGYVVLTLVVGAAVAGYSLHGRRLRLAVWVFLSGITVAVTVVAWAAQSATAFYLYLLLVLVAAVLTEPRTTWGVAVGSVALVWAIGCGVHGMPLTMAASITAFLLLAALTAWLSSRRLFTALTWALNMTSEARKSAADAQQRRAEVRSMLKSLDEAYGRLERANEALIYAREATDRAYRFKAEFVANVSHELRTPLNLVIGFSEMIATAPESYKGIPLPSEYRGDVLSIYRSARHLADLINDVLDLSQVEAGRLGLEREPADLRPVLDEAVEIVRGLAQSKGLRLEVDVPDSLPPLLMDSTRIRQVLLNLLTNATRFTDRGWIRVQALAEGQEVRVSVADSGRGIAEDRIARAFEAFTSLHDGQAGEGSGLGLAVSKRFIELHGGTMWIESTLGQGTTVGFTLPTPGSGREAPLALLRAGRAAPAQTVQPQVLVLHDDPQAVGLLRRYVEGYQFAAARTVQEACALIEEATPGAVILDPGWAGPWAEVAAHSRLPAEVPILTCPLPGLRHLAQALGAAEYLAKPVTREQLLAALSRLSGPLRKALVVDDDPDFVRLVTRVLKAHDATLGVLEAYGGEEGLALLRAQRPDVVLLDLLMPEVSGYDFLAEMKRDQALAQAPVIILSARGLEDETTPLVGEFHLARSEGFAPGQVVEVIQALLPVISSQAAVALSHIEQAKLPRP